MATSTRENRLYLLERIGANHRALEAARAVVLGGRADAAALAAAVDRVIAASGAAARRFDGEGAPQAIDDVTPQPTPVTAAPGGAREAALQWHGALPAFDMRRGGLVRAAVFEGPGDTAVVIAAHRAVADASVIDQWLASALAGSAPEAPAAAPALDPAKAEAAAAHARAGLAGVDEPAELSGDRPRPAVQSQRAKSTSLALSPAATAAAAGLAAALDVSEEAAVAAAFTALLARYTRKSELVLGRRASRGPSGNEVLLRVTVAAGVTVRDHVRNVQKSIASAEQHAGVAIEVVLDALAPPRDPSRAPLYQVGFAYAKRPALPSGWTYLDVPRLGSAMDLALEIESVSGATGATATVIESEDLFSDGGRAQRLVGHLSALLEGFAGSPEAKVSSLPMVVGAEREQLVSAFNAHRVFPSEDTLALRVERAAQKSPGAVAISCGAERVTYGELEARATRLARHLRGLGVGRDSRVGVVMERTASLVVTLYAILKAGGAYVPIEPTQPKERIEFVLGDIGLAALLTDGSLAIDAAAAGAPVIRVDQIERELANASAEPLEAAACPAGQSPADALAYVIYTSGSTGRPKGCLIQNRHVVRLFDATQEWFQFDSSDVWSFFHSVAFDFSVWEIWGALCYGGRVVVVPYDTARSPDDFRKLVAAEKVTVLNQTPSAFRQFIDADARASGEALSLRTVVFGGEALDLESLRPWYARHGDAKPRLVNMYGITETTVHVTYRPLSRADLDAGFTSVIGVAIPDLALYVVDEARELVPIGVPGELLVAGAGVSQGYWRRPELTAERFLADRFEPSRGRMYCSGDLVKCLPSGELDYLGRIDQQVKIRGYRIEIGEVETAIRKAGLVRDVTVVASAKNKGETTLVAYVVSDSSPHDLRAAARALLPDYMVPSIFVRVPVIPMTENNKVDRRALPDPWAAAEGASDAPFVPVRGKWEEAVAAVFAEVTRRPSVGASFHFFDEGGSSLEAVQAARRLAEKLGVSVPVVKLFEHPTVESLARYLQQRTEAPRAALSLAAPAGGSAEPIAIIAAAGRFPGAPDVDTLWRNLLDGKESIRFFEKAELSPALDPSVIESASYVRARGVLDAPADFDAGFFGMSRREAEITDPQQRLALELAWEALEAAGYDPARYSGAIGVYAGEYNVTYYAEHLLPRPDVIEKTGAFLAMLGNEKDFVATRIAFKLGLRGPALSIHTACSTSLVAVANAFHALRTGQCDMALAGGVAITHPTQSGYLYQEEGIASPDGHTRSFDEAAKGTVFSDGAAFVVMKRLGDAVRDGDNILAVVRGAAMNNDGGEKMSFMAPTPSGQAEVIALALAVAGVPAASIGYVEAHGTATPIGDPIEIDGLRRAFGDGAGPMTCGVGSIKSNFGHLAAASGAAGLIKAALAVKHGVIPPTLHYKTPNPRLGIEGSPFYVVDKVTPLAARGAPRRAGVSSFGVGGTNAHVIVEEPPGEQPAQPSRREAQLFVLSARSPEATLSASNRLAARLAEPCDLADAAYTLAVGRRAFSHRRFVVAKSAADAQRALQAATPAPIAARPRPSFAFAFSGQGSQYIAMGRELSRREPVFREALTQCLDLLASKKDGPGGPLDCDLRSVLDPAGERGAADPEFVRTDMVQPAIFAIEWALATLWQSIGVTPDILIGHSIGEITAATLAGVFALEDALRLIFHRGRLMQAAPPGVMLSVRAAPADIAADLAAINDPLAAVVVVNSPKLCVAGGPEASMTALAERLSARGIATTKLRVSHAFHSPMMDVMVDEFAKIVAALPRNAPKIPIVSTATGQRLSDAQATDPQYWTRHVRETVRFSDALTTLWSEDPDRIVIEVGPRGTLMTLSKQIAADPKRNIAFASLEVGTPPASADPDEGAAFARAVGLAWAHGATIDWDAFYAGERRRRVPLPSYPFERQTYLVEPLAFGKRASEGSAQAAPPNEAATEGAVGAPAEPAAPVDRRTALINATRAVFEEASGVEINDPNATFMELGLDSLSLTQCAQVLTRRVGGDVTFRQLVEGLVSLDALVNYLEGSLPADYIPAAPGAAAAAPAPPPVVAPPPPVNAQGAPAPDGEPGAKKVFGAGARIERTATALPPEQEKALQRFMELYLSRTGKSKAYAAQHRDKLADPRVVTGFKPMWKEIVYPIVVDRSDGAYLWDIDGNRWVDVTCGFGANFLGHRPPYVVEAVHAQLEKGFEIGPQHPLTGECAALVQKLTGLERVAFCNTGSEAVLAATRLARTITGRPLMVSFTGDYHGILDEVIIRGTKSLRSIPGSPGILPSAVQNNLVLDYGERSALDIIRARANDIAAVVVEPVQSRRPDLQPREFLRELRTLTAELGIALVFDEIITGFRLCPGGAQEYFGVKADLATYGKILGGGLPIGAIAGTHRFMDALDGGHWSFGDNSVPEVGVTYFAGTFVRHPLALAACKASLQYLVDQGPELQRSVTKRTAALVAAINADFKRAEAPYELTTCSSWFKVGYPDDLQFGGLLFFWLRSKGLHIWDGRVTFLTTAHTDEDCAFIREAFASTIREMQAAGFLPKPSRKDAFAVPPVPGARLGKNKDGSPAWFVPDPNRPGKYLLHRQAEPAY